MSLSASNGFCIALKNSFGGPGCKYYIFMTTLLKMQQFCYGNFFYCGNVSNRVRLQIFPYYDSLKCLCERSATLKPIKYLAVVWDRRK